MTNRKLQYWVIPPAADAEFVAAMEAVLDVYEKPSDPACPVLCMDEQPVQLIRETRRPIPATRRHAKRVDYEYERAGTASIFLFTEPLAGWREATARTSKTKLDWAVETARLLEGRYRTCSTVTLVCDNLNTHTIGAFYEAFPPTRARAIVRRLRFCHTPKHGSWLNIAENELSSLTRQCVSGRRFGEFYADLFAAGAVMVEIKAVKALAPEHQAHVINYLKATGIEVGRLVNFGNPKLEFKRLTRDKNIDLQDGQD